MKSQVLHHLLKLSGAFALFLLLGGGLFAQESDDHFYPSPLTAGLSEVIDLQGVWEDEVGYKHIVPLNYFDREHLFLAKTFDIPSFDALQDTVYLYVEAVAWSSEIFLNGYLLKVTEDPFAEHLLPIRKQLLNPKSNRLTIEMSTKGAAFRWYPARFVGIFRQISLLQADSLSLSPRFPEVLKSAPRAGMVAAWSSKNGYLSDSIPIQASTEGLFSFPFATPIVFPFRPSNQSLHWLAKKGFKTVSTASAVDSLAAYNYYPFAGELGNWNLGFWRDENMRPRADYGTFQGLNMLGKPPIKPVDRTALLIFLLVPVLSLLIIKIVAPRAYGNMAEYVTKTNIYLELVANNKFLKAEQRWLMNIVRMILTASAVALFLYYVELSGNKHILNFFSGQSILGSVLATEDLSLYELLLKTLGIIVGLNMIKYVFLNGIGRIFRAYNMSSAVQNLDVFGSYPLNILPLVPASFIFFLDSEIGWVIMYIWLGLFVLYSCRRVYLVYAGLGRLFSISVSLKILYICTLEILPWILLI